MIKPSCLNITSDTEGQFIEKGKLYPAGEPVKRLLLVRPTGEVDWLVMTQFGNAAEAKKVP